jgi:hypothetical protein
MKTLKNPSDKKLVTRLHQLVVKEKNTTLEILPHLIEVGRRGLYLRKDFGSLYDYCKGELGYSDASAWQRVKAAESIRKFPEAFALLQSGRVPRACSRWVRYRRLLPKSCCERSVISPRQRSI